MRALFIYVAVLLIMARGHQKFQSQQKNQQKQEKLKKAQSHDQKGAALKALIFTCSVCKVCQGSGENYLHYFSIMKQSCFAGLRLHNLAKILWK